MGRCGSLWDRCGSLQIVVDRCGSLWVVPGFSNYGILPIISLNDHYHLYQNY